MLLSVDVDATIARIANPTDDERATHAYWNGFNNVTPFNFTSYPSVVGAHTGLWAGKRKDDEPSTVDWASNYSVSWLSSWNETRNETFYSEAIRVELSRGLAKAEWRITPTNVSLVGASILRTRNEQQDIITNNRLTIQEVYASLVAEFDWHNRGDFSHYPYPARSPDRPQWFQPIHGARSSSDNAMVQNHKSERCRSADS